MHKAKGLTAKAVIVAAAEDQNIPGRAQGEEVDDERHLLYVSLTRAKHHLFVTYCDRRTGSQRYTGRDSGKVTRSLSRFLIDSHHRPVYGQAFITSLFEEED
jgi:DNA helicase-2/ATP-dependent DNA helicase PcrA